VIVYENLTDMFTVDGNASKAATGVAGAPAGRVRAMLTPKPETTGAAAPVVPAVPAATLRPSTTLGGAAQ
jgi:lipopolysaccharide export system protein LptA